jgi:hypothetical protein
MTVTVMAIDFIYNNNNKCKWAVTRWQWLFIAVADSTS